MHVEAAEALEKRAKLSPKNPMVWNDLGVEYVAAGQLDRAAAAFTQAHAVYPEYPLPLYNLGKLALDHCLKEQASTRVFVRKFAVEAVGFLCGSLERDPGLAPAHALLSFAYQSLGEEVLARAHLQESLRLEPKLVMGPKLSWRDKIPLLQRRQSIRLDPALKFLSSQVLSRQGADE
jgi:tetratricopeptide (TPR) repeat protein